MFLNVNKLFTYLACAYLKKWKVWNLQHKIFIWRRRYWQIFITFNPIFNIVTVVVQRANFFVSFLKESSLYISNCSEVLFRHHKKVIMMKSFLLKDTSIAFHFTKKKESIAGVFLWILQKILWQLSWRTCPDDLSSLRLRTIVKV